MRVGDGKLPAAMRQRGTPVPIPNTMGKPLPADDTWLGTARESRWPPDKKSFIIGLCIGWSVLHILSIDG